jgi:signal transduction histidine kinase
MPAIASSARTRLPRRSLRLRLTVLYGALFALSGAGLLGITYGLVAHGDSGKKSMVVSSNGQTIDSLKLAGVLAYTNRQLGAQRAAELRQLLIVSGVALLIMVVVSVLLGWWMAGRALWPVRQMTGKARWISEANLHERLAVAGPDDELKELGDTFDGLLARLENAFEAQQRFVANASHELRTPLTLQRATIEVALADPGADATTLRGVCERVLAAGGEQERLIEALLTLARSQRGLDRREAVDVAALAGRVVAGRRADEAVAVRVDAACAPAWTAGDPRLVERLIGNLVDNAVRHNVPGGWATVWAGTDGGRALVRVVNSGPPVPPERIEALFQPFQRIEDRAAHPDGLGLGLSIVAAIAGAHGAHLTATARPGGGLDVAVAFVPVMAVPPSPERARAAVAR